MTGRRRRAVGAVVLSEAPLEVSDEQALPVLLEVRASGRCINPCKLGLDFVAATMLRCRKVHCVPLAVQRAIVCDAMKTDWLVLLCIRCALLLHTRRIRMNYEKDQAVQWWRCACAKALGHPDRAASAAVPLSALRWPKDLAAWRGRVAWLAARAPQLGLPDLGDVALVATADAWLAPHLAGVRTKAQLQAIELSAILRCRVAVQSRSRRPPRVLAEVTQCGGACGRFG